MKVDSVDKELIYGKIVTSILAVSIMASLKFYIIRLYDFLLII